MDRKRKNNQNGKNLANGKNKKVKVDQSKESFLNDLRKLRLYTNEDRYYEEIKTEVHALELDWR